jgi:hypothetical protein
MLSFCFSHLIEKRLLCCRAFHEGFVSSTDAMIRGQAGRFSESTEFIRRITCSLLLWSALPGNSTTLNRQFNSIEMVADSAFLPLFKSPL